MYTFYQQIQKHNADKKEEKKLKGVTIYAADTNSVGNRAPGRVFA
jgi:hypothetical protein